MVPIDDRRPGEAAPTHSEPTPARIFDTLLYSQLRGDALKAAIELKVFTAIADGATGPDAIAAKCGASRRGIAALCDFLTVNGFLTKDGTKYDLAPDSRLFLNEHSPAYVGAAAAFLARNQAFVNLAETVRTGVAPDEDPGDMWPLFAQSMLPLAAPAARAVAERLDVASLGAIDVLDIAASHGEYGLAIARLNAQARIVGLDLPQVVEFAARRAQQGGFADRYRTIAGSAFDEALRGPYDLVLLPNLLHSFEREANARLLAKIFAALKPGGRLGTVEFVPNEDRVSPPWPAQFSLVMIAQNSGDTYTFAELEAALRAAGFEKSEAFALPPSPQTLVVSYKR